jgi:hypothetical protein
VSGPAPWRTRSQGVHLPVWLAAVAMVVLLAGAVCVWPFAGGGRGGGPRVLPRQGLMSLPQAAQGAVSAALGADDTAYGVSASDGALRAQNPAGGLDMRFDDSGVLIGAGATEVGLGLRAVGYGRSLRALGVVFPAADANRVTYGLGGMSEWYANGPLGLEQGFTIPRPLADRDDGGPLTLSIALSGNAHPSLGMGGRRVTFSRAGGPTLRYGGLVATDADGRALHSWLALGGGRLLLRVDARGARYPLRIDPFVQQAELASSDGAMGDSFGEAVAVSGDTIVVGAPLHTVGSHKTQGAAYVFQMPSAGWANTVQSAELIASDGQEGDLLGSAVAISGDTIVVGAAPSKYGPRGAVYVFEMPSSGWAGTVSQTAKLTATDGHEGDGLGASVAIAGNTIVAGAYRHTGTKEWQGAVYVYAMPASGWANASQSAELTASKPEEYDQLGISVAIADNTIVAGAYGHSSYQGAVYVYEMPSSGWTNSTQSGELPAANDGANAYLGYSVAIQGGTIVAGAQGRKIGANEYQGALYVFQMPAAGWTHVTAPTAELTASNGEKESYLGSSVAISGNTIVGGAPYDGTNSQPGAAYVFTMPASGWTNATQTAELTPSDGAKRDRFGTAVAISENTIVAGAPYHTVGANAEQGAAYTYVNPPPTVSITSPSNGATYAQGQSVAAGYSCGSSAPATVSACTGPVASGMPIATGTPGTHSFTVTASDSDGIEASQTVTYSVVPAPAIAPPPPTITAVHESASSWREGTKLAQISRKRRPLIGTTLSFALNEQARVNFSFTRRVSGRKVRGGECFAQTKENRRKPACERTVTLGTLSFTGHSATNEVIFQGRISRSTKLKPGRYTLVITATNSAGARSEPKLLSFTILK